MSTAWVPSKTPYPPTRRSDHVDTYKSAKHGEVRVSDPYQWLENNTEETEAWTTVQEKFTRAYLDKNGDRQRLEDAIRKNTNFARIGAPSLKRDDRWYWVFNSGLQAQSTLYRTKDDSLPVFEHGSTEPGGDVFFDPNLLSKDGTASLASAAFSRDGKHFAYAVSFSGGDAQTIFIRPTDKPFSKGSHDDERYPEEIKNVKFVSICWDNKSEGFFYQKFPSVQGSDDKTFTENTSDLNAMLYYHKLGTSQDEDIVIMKDDKHPNWMWSTQLSEIDRRYLELSISQDTARKNMLWIADLEQTKIGPDMKWLKVINEYDAEYSELGNDGTKFYFLTNKNAPKYKVVTIDISKDGFPQEDLIPEDKDALLSQAMIVADDKLAVVYKRNVIDEVYIHDLATGARQKRLAEDFIGTQRISGARDRQKLFVSMTGFTTPGIVACYDFSQSQESDRWKIWRETTVEGLDAQQFGTEQVWYESKDGTEVPMFIVTHRSTPKDGTAPAVQYGYGGFMIPVNPFFSPSFLTFLQSYGAVLAVPNIRGGGEFGEEWHRGGMLESKTNCFDDFIAASEYLVKNKYAAPGKVAINGGSNGGLLVAACVNRAPEGVIGAAVAEVGVHDMLKFPNFTIGHAWTSDFGDPREAADFDYIYAYSPLHNVPSDKVLPPTILLTADHDDRVVPLHSFKLAATLQHVHPDNKHPLLIRIEKKAGHGAGKATENAIKESADKWGFVAQSLGLKWKGS